MLMWIGIEKEGTNRGMKTLFVGSPRVTFKELQNALGCGDIEQVYFGAGKCSKINARVLSMFIKKYRGFYLVTVEIPITKLYCLTQKILQNVTLILTINKNEFSLLKCMKVDSIQVKLQKLKGNDKVLIVTKGIQSINVEELQGKIYKGDKVIL